MTVAPANPQMALEAPSAGWHLPQPFVVSGWAIDLGSGAGTGVDRVDIRAYASGSGTPAMEWLNVTYGIPTSAIGQTYGAQFTNSGYQQEIRGLAPGVYRLEVQARSTVTGTFNQVRDVTLTVYAHPLMWVEQPSTGTSVNQSFTISGWAVDQAAASWHGRQHRAHLGVSKSRLWAGAYLGGHADLRPRAGRRGGDLRESIHSTPGLA